MRSFSLLVAGLLLLSPAFSFGSPGSVLVRSRVCGTSSEISSSGVLVLFGGKNYVLTSAWGVLEEETGICHEVVESGVTHPATLATLDAGVGFALLETPSLGATLDLSQLTSPLPSAPDLETRGFSATGAAETKQGRIVASKSTRHHLAGLAYAFELLSDRMPNSFVGAPVYGKTLEGIVSGQWLEVVAGSYARIREWSTASQETPNHFFVIPASLIRQSLQAGFQKRATFQPYSVKLKDRAVIFAGKYKWESLCPAGAGKPPLDGVGPIGGGDGVGVGGSMKGAETCTAKVSVQNEVVLETPAYLPAELSRELDASLAGAGEADGSLSHSPERRQPLRAGRVLFSPASL